MDGSGAIAASLWLSRELADFRVCEVIEVVGCLCRVCGNGSLEDARRVVCGCARTARHECSLFRDTTALSRSYLVQACVVRE